jgi:quinolinate synthase
MVGKERDIIEKIKELKEKRNAIILAHNYQIGEVQEIADYIGDSLGLSRKAAQTDADVIVFCGVHFMAETASILCPDKIVIMPDIKAGCPMADMVTGEELRAKKREHPKAAVVCYVNTTAETKAESDICCTSANAIRVVESLKEFEEVIFVPDQYLGHYVSTKTTKKIILWKGFCPVHLRILPEDVRRLKAEHPRAEVMVHPECIPEVIALADEVLSTGGMCRHARESRAEEIIVGTEVGLLYRLQKENPNKRFYAASERAICPHMKLTNLEKVLWALEDMSGEVKVPEDVRIRAKRAIDRMMEIV